MKINVWCLKHEKSEGTKNINLAMKYLLNQDKKSSFVG